MNDTNNSKEFIAKSVGKPLNRPEGKLKVTGQAKYTSDIPVANAIYAVLILSTITRGQIEKIDDSAAKKDPKFISILTHESGIVLNKAPANVMESQPGTGPWLPLQNNEVYFNGQTIGLALAETMESAVRAAELIKVTYREMPNQTNLNNSLNKAEDVKSFAGNPLYTKWGDPNEAIKASEVVFNATYTTPIYHHNPMELHATTAYWEGDNVTIYDTTQGLNQARTNISYLLGIPLEKITIICHFVGGAFGSKFFWSRPALIAAAAKKIGKPIKLVQSRQDLFTSNGHRSPTIQEISLGADKNGKLNAIRHITTCHEGTVGKYIEASGRVTKMLYACPNLEMNHRIVKLDVPSPCPMRAPGEATGTFAIESAMDELAYSLNIDPLQLRLINYTEVNPESGKPFSSKHLKECYLKGAEAFGWSKRSMKPRTMQDGNYLVGWGMATATYPAVRRNASAKIILYADGRAIARSATQDVGTGTYAVLTQITADALALNPALVQFELGNTDYPFGAISGGSTGAATATYSIQKTGAEIIHKLIQLTIVQASSPLFGVDPQDISTDDGKLFLKQEPSKSVTYIDILKQNGLDSISAEEMAGPNMSDPNYKFIAEDPDYKKYAFHSFGVHFVEVKVDKDYGIIRLGKIIGVYDVGRILNHKTAHSQVIGGITMGIGMALLEETLYDESSGRIITRNLADYHVPVNADLNSIEAIFVEHPDTKFGAVGARGLGEIPITGVAAAIANAIFHATGKRVRDLPIVAENLI